MTVNGGKKITVVVLIDALGWEFLKTREFLSDILPVRGPVRTVLGFSSGAIPSILTGLSPSTNRHWNLIYFDPVGSPFRWLRYFRFLPDAVLDNRYGRKLIKEIGKRILNMGPSFDCCVPPKYLPWFNWAERRDIYSPGGVEGFRTIFDHLETSGTPYKVYTYHSLSDRQILDAAVSDIRSDQGEFFFLYLSEMDMFLHMNCLDEGKITERLNWYGEKIRTVFDAASRSAPDVRFAVCSDHGMTPVSRSYDLVEKIEGLGLKMPEEYLAVYDSTMARFWFFHPGARERVEEALSKLECGSILSVEELKTLGVHFEDGRYGELVFLLKPGWLIASSDFNGKGWSPVGMHGYHPEDPHSDAIFLSNRQPVGPIRTIADIFHWMRSPVQRP